MSLHIPVVKISHQSCSVNVVNRVKTQSQETITSILLCVYCNQIMDLSTKLVFHTIPHCNISPRYMRAESCRIINLREVWYHIHKSAHCS